MTNLHVIVGLKKTERSWTPGESAVGEEFTYESLPIPWLDNARAIGQVLILGHGERFEIDSTWRQRTPDEDWAIGYDLGCASQRYDLGVFHLDAPIKDPLELWQSPTFTAGFTGVKMRGLSPWEFPLYIDTACRILRRSSYALAPSHYETNCSMAAGGSGQPFLSGLVSDRANPNMFVAERGRPRLTAFGMFDSSGGRNSSVPNFGTRANAIIFTEVMRRRFKQFLEDPVAVDQGRDFADSPRPLLRLQPRYTEDARRRRVEGEIVMDFMIGPDGTVERVSLVRGLDGGLDDLALAAARKWLFAPAVRNGVPVAAPIRLPVSMRLPAEG